MWGYTPVQITGVLVEFTSLNKAQMISDNDIRPVYKTIVLSLLLLWMIEIE